LDFVLRALLRPCCFVLATQVHNLLNYQVMRLDLT